MGRQDWGSRHCRDGILPVGRMRPTLIYFCQFEGAPGS
jgi:hypothetical protein